MCVCVCVCVFNAAQGVSCSMQNLFSYGLYDLVLLISDETEASCIGSADSWPLDYQRSLTTGYFYSDFLEMGMFYFFFF